MFDIGFWELTVIGVIALLVVGPERLPGVARTIGFWTGRLRRYVSQVRDDLEHELHADELKGLLDKSSGLDGLYEMVEETKGTLDDAKRGVAELADLSELKDVADVADLADPADPAEVDAAVDLSSGATDSTERDPTDSHNSDDDEQRIERSRS